MKTLIIFSVIIVVAAAITRTPEEVNKLKEWKVSGYKIT